MKVLNNSPPDTDDDIENYIVAYFCKICGILCLNPDNCSHFDSDGIYRGPIKTK